jgi:GT2 family glycosyltransferase
MTKLITLVFNVHNSAETLEGVLDSWIKNLSPDNRHETVIVCDGCTDGSHLTAFEYRRVRSLLSTERIYVFSTDDIFEIASNNLALGYASDHSDLIVFIQDDNWSLEPNWDRILVHSQQWADHPGATALLAGGYFGADGDTYFRVETNRPHKGVHFGKHNIPEGKYPLALYSVDFVTRPFAISTPLLRELGGLGGPGYEKFCWDDTDLSVKLLRRGYTNLYLPLDIVNTSPHTGSDVMRQSFEHNHETFRAAHREWLSWRPRHAFRPICPIIERDGELKIAQYWSEVG